MVFTIPSGQSRYICWLGTGLTLTASGSPFNSDGHTIVQLSTTNGAIQSWKHARGLNSLPNSAIVQLGTYQVIAGSATLTLPDYVAGLGGSPDLSLLPTGTSPTPAPSGSTPQGTIAFTAPAASASIAAGSVTISGTYTLTSGSFTNGIQYRWNGGTWTTLVASPTGGTFSAAVNITTAATGALEVRFADNTAVTASRTITITAASPSPTPSGSATATGTVGTLTITTPVAAATVASGNVTIAGSIAFNASQTSTAVEWQFNGGVWSPFIYNPTAGTFSKDIAIDVSANTTGLFKLRFANDTATAAEVSVSITVSAPAAAPAAVATQTITIATNGFTASELSTNWNTFVSDNTVVQTENNRFLPSGNTNTTVTGRASRKVPFAITSTAAHFELAAKVVIDGTETSGTPITAKANYSQGFGISFHNDLTPQITAGVNSNFGVRDLTKSLNLEFDPITNKIELWRNPSNTTYVGGANASATATNGTIFGTVYVWVDLVATTHVLNVYVANTSTKPTTADLTLDLDGAGTIGALASYFGNQAFLTIGAASNYTAAQTNGQKPFRFETLTFSAANT